MCAGTYVHMAHVCLYDVTKRAKTQPTVKKREPVWPNKFMHNNFVILFNFSHYVCAPICTSFQSSSAGT